MKSDVLIRKKGMEVLFGSLGLVDAERFIYLLRSESFDYTEWQRDLFADVPPGELADLAMEHCRRKRNESRAASVAPFVAQRRVAVREDEEDYGAVDAKSGEK